MADQPQTPDVRAAVVQLLLQQIAADDYPSTTMMDMVEEVLTPAEVPAYAAVLIAKVEADQYPSIPMLQRLLALA